MPETTNKKQRAGRVDLTLLAAAAAWGGSYLAAKELTEVSSIFALLAIRFVAAATILSLLRLRNPVKFSRHDWIIGSAIGIGLAVTIGVETAGISLTSATNAGLIISLAIIFTPIMEGVWKRNWLPAPFFIAATGAIVGVALLVGGNGFHAPNVGDALMFVAAIFRGFYTAAQGRWTAKRKVNTFNLTILHTGVAGAIFLALDFGGTIHAVQTYGTYQWSLIIFLTLFCTVFGFLAMMWSIRKTSASRVSLLLGTEPIWAVFIGVAIGGELISWLGALGAALVIGCCYIGLGIENRHRISSEPVAQL